MLSYFVNTHPAFRSAALLLVCFGLFLASPAMAADESFFFMDTRQLDPAAPDDNVGQDVENGADVQTGGELPWHVTADKMVSLDDGIILEAFGDVVLQRGDDFLKADFARYFTTTDWVFVRGNVSVRLGRDELTATEAEFDLASSTGWLKNGSVFMAGPHIYFVGDNVIKHWGDRYTFQNAKVTACDGPVPDWSLTAQEAVVEIDGYAKLSHSSFQVRDKGILFTPYMIMPAKTTRQTGLLQPDLGVSSLHGAFTTVPWFWAIDESRDLTLYGTWLERTGFMPSVEYRSQTSDNDKTWIALDMLYDSKPIWDDADDPIDSTDGYIRKNYDRYWLRGMSQGEIVNSPWYYKYNVDYVSDQNFLREFQQRMTGFNASRSATFDFFGRDLQELDKNRVTEGYLYRDWERFRMTLGGRYEQNPALGNGNAPNSSDTTVQHLPQLTAYLFKGRMAPTFPLELAAEGSSGYMYRRTGTRGLRSEIYPSLTFPLDLNYATLLATGGLRQTVYTGAGARSISPLQTSPNLGDQQDGTSRTIPDFGMTAFTQASRIWEMAPNLEAIPVNAGRSQWTSLRHVIQPRLQYSWIPNVDQENNPFYILEDRILPTNNMYFSLTNLLTVHKQTVIANPAPEGEQPTTASLAQQYLDIARLRLGMGYDYNEASRNRHRDVYERRPFTDIMADATLTPLSWLSLWSQTYLSVYNGDITRNDLGVTLTNARWGAWSVGHSARNRDYDYIRRVQYDDLADIQFEQPLSLLRNELLLKISPRWNVGLLSNLNLKTGDHYEGIISVGFTEQCYRVFLRYVTKGNEQSYHFNIELMGF